MKPSLLLVFLFQVCTQLAPAAETPAALAEEAQDAFAKGNLSALANRKLFTVITGDIPIGRHPSGDPDGLSEPIPRLYKVASAKVLTEAEARSIEEKGYAKGLHDGYIAVDFVRREDSNPKARITAFRRYYPYEKAEGGWFLISG